MRFDPLDDATVADRSTGLVWPRNAGLFDYPMTWKEALNAGAFLGHRDWRLPAIRELESLVDLERHSPALPRDPPFVSVREYYWSATTSAYERRYAWALYLTDGAVGVGFKAHAEFFVCAVRTPQKPV